MNERMICYYTLQVHYTARFADGIVFDSSYKRGRALTMRIGVGKVNKFSVFTVNFFVVIYFCGVGTYYKSEWGSGNQGIGSGNFGG